MLQRVILFTASALLMLLSLVACADTEYKADVIPAQAKTETAVFAGGCFWCMEPPFDKIDGVYSTLSGYAGGNVENPTYQAVTSGRTSHTEVVQVVFDPSRVSYQQLLDVYWVNIDPTVQNRQFCDSGSQYRSGIFYTSDNQRTLALASKAIVETQFDTVHTEVTALDTFYPAEDYHQNYYQKNPIRYAYYRRSCGRDSRLEALWGDQAEGK